MKYKLLIFDFDGTLADTMPWVLTVVDHVAEKYKLPRPDLSTLDQMRRQDARTLIKQYKVPAWKIVLMSRYLHRLMTKDLDKINLFEGVGAMLEQVAQAGVALAVVSSNTRAIVRRVLGPDNVACIRYFECGVSVFGKHAKFKKVLKRARVRPGEALVIGDELRDFDAARRARIPFGAVAWGYTLFDVLRAHAPREAFHEIADIARLIQAPQ
jgi:phosphoglycolate phosphatase